MRPSDWYLLDRIFMGGALDQRVDEQAMLDFFYRVTKDHPLYFKNKP